MENVMTQETYDALLKKFEANELYRNSRSVHKGYQFRQMYDAVTRSLVEGQQIREEDKNGLVPGQEGFDELTRRIVIYNFKNGVLHSENDEPAIQYPGHWEYWDKGLIVKVVADGGDIEEYWENGIPVRIESNLAERRRNGENI